MLELFKFIFSDGLIFVGTLVLILVPSAVIASALEGLGRKEHTITFKLDFTETKDQKDEA